MIFKAGTRCRRIGEPAVVARITGQVQDRSSYTIFEVELPDGQRKWWRSEQIEVAPQVEDRRTLLEAGRFGGVGTLQRLIMLEKLRANLTDVFYSIGTSRTDFYPHQFKPVLRFIESTTGRLLIADEVGLGKTIEALLIWKELQARALARRLLIVCPAILREKWQTELLNRFRIEAQRVNARELKEKAQAAFQNRSLGFALVGGYEALRPPTSAAAKGARAELAAFLTESERAFDEGLFDLVIVDEAHYARNPSTSTNQLVQLLDRTAQHMVLVTATPIQLGDENLHQLLKLIDPDRFGDLNVFRLLRRQNEPIVAAIAGLLNSGAGPQAIADKLREALNYREDPIVREALVEVGSGNLSPERRVAIARSLERVSILAPSMTRTRKRDVLTDRVVRDPSQIAVTFNPIEREVYQRVTDGIRNMITASSEMGSVFALITRQRQMASCLPAALAAFRRNDDLSEELFEDFGFLTDEDDKAATTQQGVAPADLSDLARKIETRQIMDSKLAKLLTFIRERLERYPKEKFVLFSFFRGTLSYLHERLTEVGVSSFVLFGGMGDEKWKVIQKFEAHEGPAVILTSEVGSEGIDLQFCRVLINYDLPWNPMRIEQRIGRIDRLGQTAERITIVNFAVEDTIEDRIVLRLHERIDVFRRSLGDVEPIIGDKLNELIRDLYRAELDETEKQRRAEENIKAIASAVQQAQDLEEEASSLVAHRDFILSEIAEGRENGRFVEPEILWGVVTELLIERYPGTEYERHSGDGSVWRLRLSSEAKSDLAAFRNKTAMPRRTLLDAPGSASTVTVDPKWAGTLAPAPELLDVTHPLVLWLRSLVRDDPKVVHPVAAVEVPKRHASGLPYGDYLYLVDRFEFSGMRREIRLRYLAIELTVGTILSPIEAERLIQAAIHFGRDLRDADAQTFKHATPRYAELYEEMFELLGQEGDRMSAENRSMCERQAEAVTVRRDTVLSRLLERLDAAERSTDKGITRTAPLWRARLEKARETFAQQISRIERSKREVSEHAEVAAGVIRIVAN